MKNKVIAIVQARTDSTRLPNKVMKKISNTPLIEILLKRLSKSKKINSIIIATTDKRSDDRLSEYISSINFNVFRGSENDVLDRYYNAAKENEASTVIRITGDCPLVDPEIIDSMIDEYNNNNHIDLLWNDGPPTFPDGLDVEIFSFSSLEKAWKESTKAYDREHVTPYLTDSGLFKIKTFLNEVDYSTERWTIDEPEDLEVIRNIIEHFQPNFYFSWKEVVKLKETNPKYFTNNTMHKRNEGATVGTGQKLWKRAKKIIPGGNMLLSKRSEMFLPDKWPSYFKKSKGFNVWDLDGNKFSDLSIMGIGTNTLGYGHKEVDEAVINAIKKGNMSTFNCPEEVFLSEKLIELHPWAEMVRLARSGGEANSIAIRIARAASGKDKVAFCGYHGWHDWYISSNLSNDKSLDGHLLPGLEPNGVPRALADTAIPFRYNNIEELKEIISNNELGVICMEVARSEGNNKFLQDVRRLADKNNIVLIFDEISSGFRQSFGGLHKLCDVEPDIAIFAKAIGNGYPISAVIGRKNVMDSAQSSFMSSTFWTDRVGPVAALKTLEVMESIKSWEIITEIGKNIQKRWEELAKTHDLEVAVNGLPAISSFSINSSSFLEYKTFITQEMLKKGYLATNLIFTCIDHDDEIIDQYFDELDKLFSIIKDCENEVKSINELLDGPVCHSGFKRLN